MYLLFALIQELVFTNLPAPTLYGVAAAFLPFLRTCYFLQSHNQPVFTPPVIDSTQERKLSQHARIYLCNSRCKQGLASPRSQALAPTLMYLELLFTLSTNHLSGEYNYWLVNFAAFQGTQIGRTSATHGVNNPTTASMWSTICVTFAFNHDHCVARHKGSREGT